MSFFPDFRFQEKKIQDGHGIISDARKLGSAEKYDGSMPKRHKIYLWELLVKTGTNLRQKHNSMEL